MSLRVDYLRDENFIIIDFKDPQSKDLPFRISVDIDNLEAFDDWLFALENIQRENPPTILFRNLEIDFFNFRSCKNNNKFQISSKGAVLFKCETTKEEIATQMYVKLKNFVRDVFKSDERSYIFDLAHRLDHHKSAALDEFIESFAPREFAEYEGFIYERSGEDVLNAAYEFIDKSKEVQNLLRDICESKESIGIGQNDSRLKEDKSRSYRTIQHSEACICLNFSEDFAILEEIKFSSAFFRKKLRHRRFYQYFNTDKQRLDFLVKICSNFVPFAHELRKCLGDDNGKAVTNTSVYICVFKLAQRIALQDRVVPRFYDEPNRQNFYFYRDEKGDDFCTEFALRLAKRDLSDKIPTSIWLKQEVVNPVYFYCVDDSKFDFMKEYLANLKLKFDEIFKHNFSVKSQLENWVEILDDDEDFSFSWHEYNKRGHEIAKKLQSLFKRDYIIDYERKFEDVFGDKSEAEAMDKKHEFDIMVDFDGIWLGYKKVDYDELNLPQNVRDKFNAWRENISLSSDKKGETNRFYTQGLECARALKRFLGRRAFVQYLGDDNAVMM